MAAHPAHRRRRGLAAASWLLWLVLGLDAVAQQAAPTLAGRPLSEALQTLQADGLRVIFTSRLVTSGMRVVAEPRASAPAARLAELLAPHGLVAVAGPGGTLLVVRPPQPVPARRAQPSPTTPAVAQPVAPDSVVVVPRYHEQRRVVGYIESTDEQHLRVSGLMHAELDAFGSAIDDDPVRAVQSRAGAVGVSDFQSAVSARASASRHAGLVVDGVTAPWLRHATWGPGDGASLSMIGRDAVEHVSLLVGPYDRRDASQLGPQVSIALREGSRLHRRSRLTLSGPSTAAAAEGPFQRGRGSWLVGVRKSHVEWPVGRSDHQRTVFGFVDLHARVAYDIGPHQQLRLTTVAGASQIERERPNPEDIGDGRTGAALVAAAWRSVVTPRLVVTQQLSSVTHRSHQQVAGGFAWGRTANRATAYRADLLHATDHGALRAGLQLRQVRGTRLRDGALPLAAWPLDDATAVWLEHAAHASWSRTLAPGLIVTPGLRVQRSTLARRTVVDRWLRTEWVPVPRWRLVGATALTHQLPSLDDVVVHGYGGAMRPERAWHTDLGVERRVGVASRIAVTAFLRQERDVLRGAPGLPIAPSPRGSARGIELLVERRAEGLSGAVSYAYGVARLVDGQTGRTLPHDTDQRHSLSATASMAGPGRLRLGGALRLGSGLPATFSGPASRTMPGTVAPPAPRRLAPYARLDLRAEHPLDVRSGRLTLFLEAINVLNHTNVGLAGYRPAAGGEVIGVTETLFPRLVTAGVRLEF